MVLTSSLSGLFVEGTRDVGVLAQDVPPRVFERIIFDPLFSELDSSITRVESEVEVDS